EADKFVRHSGQAVQLEAVFQRPPIHPDHLLDADHHVVGGHVVILQSDLASKQVVHALGEDDHIGVEYLVARPDARDAAVLAHDLLNQDVGGDEGFIGMRTSCDRLFELGRQPAVEPGAKYDDAGVGRRIEMSRLEVDRKGRLLIHEREAAVPDVPLEAIFLGPVLGNQSCQIVAPENPAGDVLRPRKFTSFYEQKASAAARQLDRRTQPGDTAPDDDAIELFVHGEAACLASARSLGACRGGLAVLQLIDEARDDVVQITDDPIGGHPEYGRIRIFVDGHDHAAARHPGYVLDGT